MLTLPADFTPLAGPALVAFYRGGDGPGAGMLAPTQRLGLREAFVHTRAYPSRRLPIVVGMPVGPCVLRFRRFAPKRYE